MLYVIGLKVDTHQEQIRKILIRVSKQVNLMATNPIQTITRDRQENQSHRLHSMVQTDLTDLITTGRVMLRMNT